jgi:hypothetical protein
VKEPVFVKEGVEHASVNLLLFDHIRLLKLFHRFNQLSNSMIDLRCLCVEYVLEVVVCCRVDLFGVLGRTDLLGE